MFPAFQESNILPIKGALNSAPWSVYSEGDQSKDIHIGQRGAGLQGPSIAWALL